MDGQYLVNPPEITDGAYQSIRIDQKGNTITNPMQLDKTNDSITAFPKPAVPVNLSASGQILSAPGQIVGYVINSHTAGATVRIADNTVAGSGYLGAAFTTVSGHLAGVYQPYPAQVLTGGYVTITGTIDITFFVIPV